MKTLRHVFADLPRALKLWVIVLAAGTAHAQPETCPLPTAAPGARTLVVISDLHVGLGRDAEGRWDPREDFRWSGALQGFLDQVSRCSSDRADLVIAGDLLELWQPPDGIACRGPNEDLGCTPQELTAITRAIVSAHGNDLQALGRFADRGDNRLVLIPGNHDAALMLAEPWRLVQEAMGAHAGRISRAESGQVLWADGRVLVEHGHQIGNDANRYETWPLVTREHEGQTYVVRPWGERFVQRLFNEQEREYSVIDNLSPEAAGARYRMTDRGLWGSIADVARFLAFNLFETSLTQKAQFLGANPGPNAPPPPWDLAIGRGLGHRLFANALSTEDPFRGVLLAATSQSEDLRKELDTLARDPKRLPDAEVESLCDQVAARHPNGVRCQKLMLGAMMDKLLRSKRAIMTAHLRERLTQPGLGAMRVFIYGHTHEFELPWPVQATDLRRVAVLNSGAFQRVVDEAGFLRRAHARGWTPERALRELSLDELAPCYTAVVAVAGTGQPDAMTVRWHQPEDAPGRFVDVEDAACR